MVARRRGSIYTDAGSGSTFAEDFLGLMRDPRATSARGWTSATAKRQGCRDRARGRHAGSRVPPERDAYAKRKTKACRRRPAPSSRHPSLTKRQALILGGLVVIA